MWGGVGGCLAAIGVVAVLVGMWSSVRGAVPGLIITSRIAAVGVAVAGLGVIGAGESLLQAADSQPVPTQVAAEPTSSAPATTRPTSSRPVQAAASTVAPTTTAATATTSLPLRPAPVMLMTCPSAAAGAVPVFDRQISAAGPFSVTIDYGDGEVYANDDHNLGAVFSHRYPSAGTFVVQAVLTDVAGLTATASCSYTWNAPQPVLAPVPAPVVGSTSANSGGGSAAVSDTGAYYQNCDAVRAAGAAPIYPGDPGFQSKFDRDDDGVGCES